MVEVKYENSPPSPFFLEERGIKIKKLNINYAII
jgi:hypothetical protein